MYPCKFLKDTSRSPTLHQGVGYAQSGPVMTTQETCQLGGRALGQDQRSDQQERHGERARQKEAHKRSRYLRRDKGGVKRPTGVGAKPGRWTGSGSGRKAHPDKGMAAGDRRGRCCADHAAREGDPAAHQEEMWGRVRGDSYA